jgi:hypothetical protein
VSIAAIDVACLTCNVHAGTRCRGYNNSLSLSPIRRSHRDRVRRCKNVEKMNRLAMLLLFNEWPSRDEIESIARLADGDDRDRAAILLTLVENTGYEGELF